MTDFFRTIDLLRQKIQADSSLQASLFEIRDVDEFVSALSRLAEEIGCFVAEEELMSVFRQGQRNWIERDLL